MNEFLDDPRFWVAAAFVLFIVLGYKKLTAFILGGLDSRSARIRAELVEARRLRQEAEGVLAEYRQKQNEYLKEAEAIMLGAQKDASTLSAYTEKELREGLDSRMKQAIEKIAQEEAKAIADVRNHVVDIALAAARSIIVDHVSTMSQEDLVRLALSDIERKIH